MEQKPPHDTSRYLELTEVNYGLVLSKIVAILMKKERDYIALRSLIEDENLNQ